MKRVLTLEERSDSEWFRFFSLSVVVAGLWFRFCAVIASRCRCLPAYFTLSLSSLGEWHTSSKDRDLTSTIVPAGKRAGRQTSLLFATSSEFIFTLLERGQSIEAKEEKEKETNRRQKRQGGKEGRTRTRG